MTKFYCTILLCVAALAYSQRTIRGTVTDADDGSPLMRARVLFADEHGGEKDDSTAGIYTDSLGKFIFYDAPAGLIELNIRMPGYTAEHVHLDPGQDEVIVELHQEVVEGGSVTVTGARYETVVEDACCNVDAMNIEFAELAPFSASPVDILRRYSSCTSSKIYSSSDHSSGIRLRGLDGTRVHLRLDGMPVFGALSLPFALEHISAGVVQGLNIYEGVSSAAYGNGAISGVVDIATRLPIEPSELAIALNGASELQGDDIVGEKDVSASYAGGVSDKTGIAVYGAYNGHTGEFQDGISVSPDYDRFSFMAKSRMLIDESRLTVGVIGAFEERSSAESNSNTILPGRSYSEEINTNKLIAQARLETVLSGSANLFLQAAATNVDVSGQYAKPFDATENVFYGAATATDLWGDHLVKFGAEARSEQIRERSSYGIGSKYSTISIFAEDEWILSQSFQLFAAGRFDNHSIAGSLFSPRFGITIKPEETFKIKLSTGQGFKGQALFDEEHLILHGFYSYHANPDLGFEKSWTYNLDVAHDYDLGFVSGGINFIGYYSTIAGRAIPQADSLAAGTYYPVQSADPSRLYGIEITTRPVFDEYWSGAIGIGAVRYEHHNTTGSYDEAPLVPVFTIDLSVVYRDPETGWTAETWGSIIGSQKMPEGLSFTYDRSPVYGLFNVRLAKRFGIVTVHTGVLNLLDKRSPAKAYSDSPNPLWDPPITTAIWGPLEGREFFLGCRISL